MLAGKTAIVTGADGALGRAVVAAAREAGARVHGFDLAFAPQRRKFFYLPFEHSENLADQVMSEALFATVDAEALRYAVRHREIVERFGRFPHRNAALGRTSTAAEVAFLTEPMSSF